ncbi:MAG: hypothetical protein Q8N23_08850 [Archangium sp.]|nr:hypothetical protein [Archangium sp.]MDP3152765.1 hypothetical protein [Archangium sp.]MDP3573552.1 hypothetical protein [Archangium sp.]
MTSRGNAHRTISSKLLRMRGFFRPSRGLQARVRRVTSLTKSELDSMWTLFESAYAGARRDAFERDLSEKHHVIVLKDVDHRLQGFSTLLRLEVEGACVVFSGDTIVAPGFWGQTALQRAFIWYLMTQRHAQPGRPVYWFLITKGYRTYLLISRYFPNHWPRHDAPLPVKESALLDTLCTAKFGTTWDAAAGLLRYAGNDAVRLTASLADVPKRLESDPDVKFFLQTNPRWAEGDELCCLARADDEFVEKTTRIFL